MLRRGILVVVLGLAACDGCTAIEPGRYQCDPTLPAGPEADAQCPGASRCGLEGYCHRTGDTSVAWKCTDDRHCENGFACGLSRDRLSRECHDPQAPDAGYPCDVDSDCVRGWHCGPLHVCYDRRVPGAFACRADAGDCSDGWRCGLDAVCHDRKVAAPYPCLSDLDCEQEWRCGLDGRCLDPAVDALRAGGTALGPLAKLSPLLLDHPPQMLEVSPVQNPTFNTPRQQLVLVDEGTLRVLDLSVGGVPPFGTNPHRVLTLPDAGPIVALASLGSVSLDPFARRDVGTWTYLARPTGELMELHFRTTPNNFEFDGGVFRYVTSTEQIFSDYITFGPDRLRVGSTEPGFVPTLTAFDRRPFMTGVDKGYFAGWGAFSRAWFQLNAPPHTADFIYYSDVFDVPAGNRMSDLVAFTAHRQNPYGYEQTDCMVMANDRGLFVQQGEYDRVNAPRRYVPAPLVATPFSNGECTDVTGEPQSHRITHLAGLGSNWLAVGARPIDDAGVVLPEHQVALLDVSSWWDVLAPNSTYYPFRGCATVAYDARCQTYDDGMNVYQPTTAITSIGPCRVCSGGALISVSAVSAGGGAAKLEVRCRFTEADGGSPHDSILELAPAVGLGSQCVRTTLSGETPLASDPVMLSTSNAEQLAFAGPRGHLWAGRSTASALPVFFDLPAAGAFADAMGAPVFLSPDRIGWFADGYGVLAFRLNLQDGDRPVVPVAGSDREFISAARAVMTMKGVAPGDPPVPLVLSDGAPTRFDAPFQAVRAKRRDSQETVVVSANDSVFAVTLGTPKAALVRRLVPAEGKAIVALLPVTPPLGGPLLTVYALTTAGLFRITAETEQLWVATPAPLPPGDAVALWADGPRGRIGFSDGRVYGLETRVQIGAGLGTKVDAYAQLCGQAWALADGSLHRLDLAPSQAIGQWKAVPLVSPVPTADFQAGSLVPFAEPDGGTSLYVFSRRGEVVRASVSGCP